MFPNSQSTHPVSPPFRLDGLAALVTGVRPGIGSAVAMRLAEAGARVVLANRTVEQAQVIGETLRNRGYWAHAVDFEATEAGAMRCVDAAIQAAGQLDILIHNAGGAHGARVGEMTSQYLDEALDVNLKSCFWLTRGALPALRRSQQGRIIITSSVTGPKSALPGASHYAAAKAGVNGFIRSAALELACHGITVNGVEPGFILKDRGHHSLPENRARVERYIPMGRMGTPNDIAYAMLFLASAEAKWITGQTLVIDGGSTLPETGFAMDVLRNMPA